VSDESRPTEAGSTCKYRKPNAERWVYKTACGGLIFPAAKNCPACGRRVEVVK
jgi:hypothetical protein